MFNPDNPAEHSEIRLRPPFAAGDPNWRHINGTWQRGPFDAVDLDSDGAFNIDRWFARLRAKHKQVDAQNRDAPWMSQRFARGPKKWARLPGRSK